MKYMLHLTVTHIIVLVDIEHLMVVFVLVLLVEYAQYPCQTVVHTPMQKRYLDNDTVMGKALYKRVRHAVCHLVAVIVIRPMANVKHRLLNISHTVTEQIYRYHRDAVAVGTAILVDIVGVGILRAEILAETQCLRFQPCLL